MIKTLIELLSQYRDKSLDKGITFIKGGDNEVFLSYSELYYKALRRLHHLQNMGIGPGDELILQVENIEDYLITYWASILGGIIPIPVEIGRNLEHRLKFIKIWESLEEPRIVSTQSEITRISQLLKDVGKEKKISNYKNQIIEVESFSSVGEYGKLYTAGSEDIAFIQFSSGSTGTPKGVMLTHANLIQNIKGIGKAGQYSKKDSTISWMPLTHDMGMIGFHLNPLLFEMNQFLMPTSLFIRRPRLWLDKVSKHNITVLSSPNFGLKYLLKNSEIDKNYNWNLDKVRIIYNGAEPISPAIADAFCKFLEKYGLSEKAMSPVYGLAEATLGVTISDINQKFKYLSVNRETLKKGEQIKVVATIENGIDIVNVGSPINGCEIRIVNETGEPLAEKTIGQVVIRGQITTAGYYKNIEKTKDLFFGEWLKTGDLGFMWNNELYISGREKDVIFINGQNFYSHDLERVSQQMAGVELNKIIFVGFYNKLTNEEEVICFVLDRKNGKLVNEISYKLKNLIRKNFGFELSYIEPVKSIPRTTSGKLQRGKLLNDFLNSDKVKSDQTSIKLAKKEINLELLNSGSISKKLAHIWNLVLEIPSKNLDECFFYSGGNSLKAVDFLDRIEKEFGVEISLEIFYENSSLRKLSNIIKSSPQSNEKEKLKSPKRSEYLATSAQKRLYYLWKLNPESTTYNLPFAFQIIGKLDKVRFKEVITTIINNNDSFKIKFKEKDLRIYISFNSEVNTSDVFFDLNLEKKDISLENYIRPFDLEIGPLFRFNLFAIDAQQSIFFCDFHHTIFDGISLKYFLESLQAGYQGKAILKSNLTFADFAHWKTSKKINPSVASFWKEKLSDINKLQFDYSLQRPEIFGNTGVRLNYKLSSAHVKKIREFAQIKNCSSQLLFISLFRVLLNYLGNNQNIAIGVPLTERVGFSTSEPIIGMMAESLPIISKISTDWTFEEVLYKEKEEFYCAFDNRELAFEDIIKLQATERDIKRNPVFDTMVNFHSYSIPQTLDTNTPISWYEFPHNQAKFDISLDIFKVEKDKLNLRFEFNTEIIPDFLRRRILNDYISIIEICLATPSIKLNSLYKTLSNHSLISNDNSGNLLYKRIFNQGSKNLEHLIIREMSKDYTYQDLLFQAESWCKKLKEAELRENSLVAVLIPRSFEFIAAILGVMKHKSVFIPLDCSTPAQKVENIVKESGSVAILRPEGKIEITNFRNDSLYLGPNNESELKRLCYIIYTSGTTGNPKGVKISNEAILNYLEWSKNYYLDKEQISRPNFAFFTSVGVDLTLTSVLLPLIAGGSITIFPNQKSELGINDIFSTNSIDIIKLTPSHFKLFRSGNFLGKPNSNLKSIIFGGENLETFLVNQVKEIFGSINIYNEYGPTETTVGSLVYKVTGREQESSIPIGEPIDHTTAYILNADGEDLGANQTGELFIGGRGLSLGYLNNPSLSNKKFKKFNFACNSLLYRTGDRAYFNKNGIFFYVGRDGEEIKFHGHRIDTEEIKHAIIRFPEISDSYIKLEKEADLDELWAFCVLLKDYKELDVKALRSFLTSHLPKYMIPTGFIVLDHLPVGSNEKIDSKELNRILLGKKQETNTRGNNIESLFPTVWKEVLQQEEVTDNDNFFSLGGDSISALQISSKLSEKGFNLKATDILLYKTFSIIKGKIEDSEAKNKIYLKQDNQSSHYLGEFKPTPIMNWFFGNQFSQPGHYNQVICLEIPESFEIKLIEQSFNLLIRNHSTLRLNYCAEENCLFVNRKYAEIDFHINIENDLQNNPENNNLEGRPIAVFDIEKDLLISATVRREKNKFLLWIFAHHLIIDGYSWRIILDDLFKIYNSLSKGEIGSISKPPVTMAYWADKLRDKYKIKSSFDTNADTPLKGGYPSGCLLKNAVKYNATINYSSENNIFLKDVGDLQNLLLSSYLKAHSDLINLETLRIEVENHGRDILEEKIDVSRTVGWFTVFNPITILPNSQSTWEIFQDVKEQLAENSQFRVSYTNGSFQTTPNIRFNFLGHYRTNANDFKYRPEMSGLSSSPHNHITADIEVNTLIVEEDIFIDITANPTKYSIYQLKSIIAGMDSSFKSLLQKVEWENKSFFPELNVSSLDPEDLENLFQ
jgi:amino acid adenylation domain-containing protein